MKTLKELRELRADAFARAEAINTVAEEEKRDLLEEEKAAYDAITAPKTGEIDRLNVDIARAERREEVMKQAALTKARVERDTEPQDGPKKIKVPASACRGGRLVAYKTQDDAYSTGQWFLANFLGNEGAATWCRDHGVQVRNVLTGAGGGNVLVPDILENAVIDLKEDFGVFRQNAQRWPMGSDTSIVPRRSSGLTTYFVGEETATTASDVVFDDVKLIARTLSALTKFSTEIASDAVIAISEMLTRELAYGLAVKEDQCGFLGDGTSTYGGITGLIGAIAAGSQVEAASGNTAFSTLDLADFISMVGKLPQYPGIMPKWYISQAGWAASMMRLAEAAGGNTVSNVEGGVGKSFLGFPVVIAQSMNSTLTAQTSTDGLCYFGDLGMGALFGDRRGLELFTSEHRYMEYRQVGIIASQRFDINIHGAGSATAAGPIIMLTTPSP